MRVQVIGIDCATVDVKVGLARGWFEGQRPKVVEAALCARKVSAVATVTAWVRDRTEPTLLAIDAPLGWPAPLATALVNHHAGDAIDTQPHDMFRRETDRVIRKEFGKTPLDVGADRIARTAHRALQILGELRRHLGQPIPLAWDAAVHGPLDAIEVHPAATIHARGWPSTRYKAEAQRQQRLELLRLLAAEVDLPSDTNTMEASADALEAAICILAGADFLAGRAPAPKNLALAKREGWIWTTAVRRRPL